MKLVSFTADKDATAVRGRQGEEAVVQGWGEAGEWVGSGKGGGGSTAVQGWGAVEAGVVHCLQGCAPVSGRGMGRGQQRRGGEQQGNGGRAAEQSGGEPLKLVSFTAYKDALL